MTKYVTIKPLLAFQRAEVEEHQWYMGERFGRPVGIDEALVDWTGSEQAARFATAFAANSDAIYANCRETCGDMYESVCPGFEPGCVLPKDRIHKLLQD